MVTTRGLFRAAGTALMILSGCAGSDYFSLSYWQRDSSGQTAGLGITRTGGATTTTLTGNPDVLAQRFRKALAQLGMQAQISSDAESVRISSTTRSGKTLTIVLRQDTKMGGENTQVSMEWTGGSDGQIEGNLLRLAVGVGAR